VALSRPKHGFESRWGRHTLYQSHREAISTHTRDPPRLRFVVNRDWQVDQVLKHQPGLGDVLTSEHFSPLARSQFKGGLENVAILPDHRFRELHSNLS
jgi:hypothetical protein